VELRSPSNTITSPCWNCNSHAITLPFCNECGKIQELSEALTPFALLGEIPSLVIDGEALRGIYFGISKKIHPDRFSEQNPREALYASRWSRALNQAYSRLKEREARAEAILELHHREGLLKKGAVPVPLAEAYFEFQEKVSEGHDLTEFLKVLGSHRETMEEEWRRLETITLWSEKELKALADVMTLGRYLTSMENDIHRRVKV